MAVAAHGLREGGDFRGEGEVVGGEVRQERVDGRRVVLDQLAFHFAFLGPAEGVEGRAAQALQ